MSAIGCSASALSTGTGGDASGDGLGQGPMDGGIEAGDPGPNAVPFDLVGKAFDLTMTLDPNTPFTSCDYPAFSPLSLHVLSATDTQLGAIVGSPNEAVPATLDWNGSAWALNRMTVNPHLWIADTKLRFTIPHADGVPHVTGSGLENGTFYDGDMGCQTSARVAIAGLPLQRAAKWQVHSPAYPLLDIVAGLDTPLVTDATASLLLPGGRAVAMTPIKSNGFVTGFKSGEVIPFGATLTLDSPSLGLGSTARPESGTITTIADPGVVASANFEDGGSGTITSYLGVPAISGQRSALVQGLLLMHLQRPPGASTLVLRARRLSAPLVCTLGNFSIAAGVVGGTHRATVEIAATGESYNVPPDTYSFELGAVQEIRLALEDTGPDALLLVSHTSGDYYSNVATCARTAGLIDDVHLE